MSPSRLSLKGVLLVVAGVALFLSFVAWACLWTGTRCVAASLRVVHADLRPGDTSTSDTQYFTVFVCKFANGGSVYCLGRSETARGAWCSRSGDRIKINGRTVQVEAHSQERWVSNDHASGDQVVGWEHCRFQLRDLLSLNYAELDNVWSELQQLKLDNSKSKALP